MPKPLDGVKVLEIAGLAPAPFAGLFLADFGADVVVVDRASRGSVRQSLDTLRRGKRSIALDLKAAAGVDTLKKLAANVDVLIEPFRPGVMERLGLGPEVLCALNPRLIYCRMTGFGQGGVPEVEKAAGHDVNYLAASGILSLLRRQGERPSPPINLLGDFAGGGLMCAVGALLALMERNRSGKGQVVDAAMVDGAAYLAMFIWKAESAWNTSLDTVGTNSLDGGAPFYNTYTCKDGKHICLGSIESQFFDKLVKGMGFGPEKIATLKADQHKRETWPATCKLFEAVFMTKTRDEWAQIFHGVDACCFPVLDIDEARAYEHNVKRKTFAVCPETERGEPLPAPKLSRTPGHQVIRETPQAGQHTEEVLAEWAGLRGAELRKVLEEGAAAAARL